MHAATLGSRAARCALAILAIACTASDGDPDRIVDLPSARLFDAAETLNGVRDLDVDAQGGVWVVSATAPHVHHFDSGGRLVASFGRKGQGPGELGVAYDVLAPTDRDSAVRIWDPLAKNIAGFTDEGTLHGISGKVALTQPRVPLVNERMSFGRLMPIARWNSGYLLQDIPPREVRGFEGTASIGTANLLVLDSTGAIIDTLVAFSTFSGPTRPSDGVLELAPIPLWTTCTDGSAIVMDPYGRRILGFSSDGALARSDTLPLDGAPITDADITVWIRNATNFEQFTNGAKLTEEQIAEAVKGFLTDRRGMLGAVSPPAVRMICDDGDEVWLQRFSTADSPGGLGREWVVIANGRIVRRYRFPDRFQPMALRRGLAYGIHTDSLDAERVATVTIPR
jgi:hypothetical protein